MSGQFFQFPFIDVKQDQAGLRGRSLLTTPCETKPGLAHKVICSLYSRPGVRIAFSKNATTSVNIRKLSQGKAKTSRIDATIIREAVRPMRNPLRNVKFLFMVLTGSYQKCWRGLCPGSEPDLAFAGLHRTRPGTNRTETGMAGFRQGASCARIRALLGWGAAGIVLGPRIILLSLSLRATRALASSV